MSDAMAAAQCIDDLKEAGLNYDQARTLVEFIVRSQAHLATKEDIKALENRIDGLEVKIAAQGVEINSLKVEMKAFEARLTRQMYFFGFGGDIPAFFARYRDQLSSRRDIAGISGLSEGDLSRLRALYDAAPANGGRR